MASPIARTYQVSLPGSFYYAAGTHVVTGLRIKKVLAVEGAIVAKHYIAASSRPTLAHAPEAQAHLDTAKKLAARANRSNQKGSSKPAGSSRPAPRARSRSPRPGGSSTSCTYCKKSGHTYGNCFERKRDKQDRRPGLRKPD